MTTTDEGKHRCNTVSFLFGAIVSVAKVFPMTAQRICLGSVVDLGAARVDGHVPNANHPGAVRELADEVQSAADKRHLPPAQAGEIAKQAGLFWVEQPRECSRFE